MHKLTVSIQLEMLLPEDCEIAESSDGTLVRKRPAKDGAGQVAGIGTVGSDSIN